MEGFEVSLIAEQELVEVGLLERVRQEKESFQQAGQMMGSLYFLRVSFPPLPIATIPGPLLRQLSRLES